MSHPRGNLILDGTHVVAGRNHRSWCVLEGDRDIWLASLLARMHEIPLLGIDGITTQLIPRRDRPDIGGYAPLVGQHVLCLEPGCHRYAGDQDLRTRMITFQRRRGIA